MKRTAPTKAGFLKLIGIFWILVPTLASGQYCTPTANCNVGDLIENFTFNTISNLNSGGSNCATTSYINTGQSTTVTVGVQYGISMQAGSAYQQGFGVWIDYNQDNDFDDFGEYVYASPTYGFTWYSDSIIVSASASIGTTRMRVRCAYVSVPSSTQSCSAFVYGETEDYTIVIVANNQPPSANFTSDVTSTCNGTVNFIDQTLNAPTSWNWDFGDGSTSTQQSPTYTYSTTGVYTVSLTVANGFGTDSITQVNYINSSLIGPISALCTPGTTTHCCQMGIVNFQLGSINNTSTNGSAGYEDFSCGSIATVTMNLTYQITVEVGNSYEENINVWIDYNNNGIFSAGEQVLNIPQVMGVNNASITIPASAVTGSTLRMRVGSDWWQNPSPTSCTDVQYGQFEDYGIIVEPDTVPPVANFIASGTLTCTGIITFTDLSTISPTSWLWDFGDGNSSTAQNPTHTYLVDSTYSVSLVVTNPYGSDSITFSNYIQVNVSGSGPSVPSCTPASLTYCCGFGIIGVDFNSISSVTSDGSAGYEDLTCSFGTNVVEGQTYTFSADMSAAAPGLHNIRAWIDYNGDGVFNGSEQVYADDNVSTTSGPITIASGGVLNTAIRMRISADYDFEAVPTPCSDLVRGQTEDYSITVTQNTIPPVAGFSAINTTTCDGSVSFIDESTFVPMFWIWDFGDTQTSFLQNPVHTYTADGDYTVTLMVANSNGSDTLVIANYITVALGTGAVPSSCTPSTLTYCCGYGIYNVSFAGISNGSGGGEEGYQDFSCTQQAYVNAGQSYAMSVTTGLSNPQDTRVWIDYNNDGILDDATERVFTEDDEYSPLAAITIPLSAVQDTALRMRVSSDFSGGTPGPCSDPWYSDVEDYSIVVGSAPVSSFSAADSTLCLGDCISFTDLSSGNPSSWNWTFWGGTPVTSNDENPANICYTSNGTYTVTLEVTNFWGTNTQTMNSFVTVSACQPIPDFISSTDTICLGECLNFTDQSTNNPTSWSWSFPGSDSASSSVQNPSGICYSTPGVYDVTLTVTNPSGSNSLTKSSLVVVNSCNPVASFTSNLDSICESTCVTFTDQSLGSPTTWAWSFPGGIPDTSNAENPTNICYATAGNYDVSLVVSNGLGPDTIVMSSYISVVACPPPVADFGAIADTICIDQCLGFNDMTSNLPDSWSWYFPGADSVASSAQNPNGICYSAIGSYDVTLVVSNPSGTDSITKTDFITVVTCVPTAIFTSVADTFCEGICTDFTDQSTGNPTAWAWSFPGGTPDTSNLQNPTGICYATSGNYDVALRVTNPMGSDTLVTTDYMTVLFCPLPVANFNASTETICISECLNFTDSSEYNPDTWTWYFPGADSTTSSDQNPTNICYSTSGTYDVTLVVTNTYGSDSITKSAYITANSCPPTSSFTSNTTSMCITGCASFTDQSTDGPTTWAWSFPGGSPDTSNIANPSGICYTTAGVYDVILVTSNFSGSDTVIVADYITVSPCPAPTANFNMSDSTLCLGECISVGQLSQDATSWYWSFENGTPSSSFSSNPGTICFTSQPGTHTVRLIVGNTWGEDTMIRSIQVSEPAVDMVVPDTLFQNIVATFLDNSNSATSWNWDLGDGSSTNLQNPSYAYSSTGNFTVKLVVTDANGCTDSVSKVIVVVQFIGQEELSLDQVFTIYPNPATDKLHIKFAGNTAAFGWLKIENMLGELLYVDRSLTKVSSNIELNIDFLPNGIYTIKIGNSQGSGINKFIKQ